MGKDIKKNIFSVIIVRLIAVTSLVVSAVIIQYSTSIFLPLFPFYYLVIAIYFLSLIYFLLYLWGKNYALQADLQVFFDLLFITALVYFSGGLNGSFYFLYVFGIIQAAVLLSARAAYITAACAAILFGTLVDGMYFKIIPYFIPEQEMEWSFGHVIYSIFLAWGIFFVIAFLTNYLVENLKKAKGQLIRAKKELEIKRRLAVAGQVSASLAHEVRNPLAAIAGSAQLLSKELKLGGEQKKLLDIISKESRRVSQSVEEYLGFTIPGKKVFSWIDLSSLLKETLLILRRSGRMNGIYKLEGNYGRENMPYYGSSNQFKQIFWNLLTNSIKAMPGGGTLSINLEKLNGKEVQIRVADTGKGMTEEERERIFEPFYSGFREGKGLGMSIVRQIVKDYEGRIEIDSQLYKGTEVRITLPVNQAKDLPRMEKR